MTQIDARIMGQSYKLACREDEAPALRAAVAYVDERMCSIRDAGRVLGNDRIAVMAALEMAAELLAMRAPDGPLSDMSLGEVQQKITAMHALLDDALAPQENLF